MIWFTIYIVFLLYGARSFLKQWPILNLLVKTLLLSPPLNKYGITPRMIFWGFMVFSPIAFPVMGFVLLIQRII